MSINKSMTQFLTILVVGVSLAGIAAYTYPKETAEAHEPTPAELKLIKAQEKADAEKKAQIADTEAKAYELLEQAESLKKEGQTDPKAKSQPLISR